LHFAKMCYDSLRNVYHKSKDFRQITEDRNKAIIRKQKAADFFNGHDNSLLPRRWKELLRQAKVKHTATVQKYLTALNDRTWISSSQTDLNVLNRFVT